MLLVILACTLVFLIAERSTFLSESTHVNGEKYVPLTDEEKIDVTISRRENPDLVPLQTDMDVYQSPGAPTNNLLPISGDAILRREFAPNNHFIKEVALLFSNPSPANTQGKIIVSIEDANGSILGTTELAANKVGHLRTTNFSFTGNTDYLNTTNLTDFETVETDEGKGVEATSDKLYVCMEAQGVNGDSFGIYLSNDCEYDESNPVLFMAITGRSFAAMRFALLLLAIAVAAFCIFFRWAAHKTAEHVVLYVLFFATPLFCFLVLLAIAETAASDILSSVFSLKGILNLMIIGFFWWLFYSLGNRKQVAIVGTCLLSYLLGLVNYALLQFRDIPLMVTDISNISTAMDVLPNYHLQVNESFLVATVLAICWIVACLPLKDGNRKQGKKVHAVHFAILVVWGILFYALIFQSNLPRDNDIYVHSFKPKATYVSNGYMLSFWLTASNQVVQKPTGYSVDKVREVASEYHSDTTATQAVPVSEESPNIIVVVNESFSDIGVLGEIPASEDCLAFYHSLSENTVKGTAYSSVFAGRTASSEFEVLTGFSMRFFPYFTVPYASLIKDPVPNLTYTLKDGGYGGAIAFHPGAATSYNRDTVYPLLGFDEHVALEDLDNPDLLRAYVSDEYDYNYVIERYEDYRDAHGANDPFYLFNVTIQNHGGYSDSTGNVSNGVTITEHNLNYRGPRNYLNLIKTSDEALEGLIGYFSEVDDPTVIMLLGDHQPNLGSAMYTSMEKYFGEEIDEEKKYEVPFLIWANYDIPEKDDELISLNYLSSYLLNLTGGRMTGFNKYLMDLHEELPVITDRLIIDKNGTRYTLEDNNPYTDLLNTYQILQYNGFTDKRNRVDEFFSLAE